MSRADQSRGIGIGMVIAAAIVAQHDDTLAEELLHVTGMTTVAALRAGGCDDYDIVKLRFVIQNIAVRKRHRLDAANRGFGPIDDMAVAA